MKVKDILKEDHINEKKLALQQVLNLSIPELILNNDYELKKDEYKKYQKIEKSIKKGIPIQYALKKTNFYGYDFYINKNVLIPRPETEYLVKETNNLIEKHFKNKDIKILDIGTGSGVIAITLNKINKSYQITATDISKKALKVAKNNQKKHKTNVKLIKTDLYQNIKDKYDVIISNPPYIEENTTEIEQTVKEKEPNLALFGGEDGLEYYKRILKDIKRITKKNHIIAFEIGENRGNIIKEMIKEVFPNDYVTIEKDYNEYDRYVYATTTRIDKKHKK